jgi:hypothetical protein
MNDFAVTNRFHDYRPPAEKAEFYKNFSGGDWDISGRVILTPRLPTNVLTRTTATARYRGPVGL